MTDLATEAPGELARFLDTDLTHEIQFLTARVTALGNSHANSGLKELGLKVRSFSVLSLAASGLAPSQREIGAFLGLDPSQVVALVDQLENKGLVSRQTDTQDRRSKTIVATTEGRNVYEKAHKITLETEDTMQQKLSNNERAQLRELLMKVAF